MRKFFDPKSVVVVGVPRKTGAGAYNNVEAMINYGYKGHIYPVNPKAKEICGLKSYPSVLEVPQLVDLAVISVGRDRVLPIFEECVQAGIRRVIIVSQGFAEADARGARLQEQIVSLAREHGVRVVGPNTMGVLNNFRNLNISFGSRSVSEKVSHASLISQTGMMLWAPVRFGYQDWGKAIDTGNSCDVDFVDALEYFDSDPETQVIVMHMEGIKRGEEFLKTATRVTNNKPVIVLKTGRSKAGAKSAVSHTASLVGEDEVFDAAFRRAGIIRVKNGSELRDAVRALLLLQEMEGPRLGIITITGAAGIMSLDACEDFGLRPADIPPTLSQKLEEGMPDWLRIENPADIWPVAMIGGNFVEIYGKTIAQLLQSPEIDGILAIAYATSASDSSFYPFLGLIEPLQRYRIRQVITSLSPSGVIWKIQPLLLLSQINVNLSPA
jgi:acetyltransferase